MRTCLAVSSVSMNATVAWVPGISVRRPSSSTASVAMAARATGRSSDNTRGRTVREFSKRFFAAPPSSIRTVKMRFVTASKSCVTVTAFFSLFAAPSAFSLTVMTGITSSCSDAPP